MIIGDSMDHYALVCFLGFSVCRKAYHGHPDVQEWELRILKPVNLDRVDQKAHNGRLFEDSSPRLLEDIPSYQGVSQWRADASSKRDTPQSPRQWMPESLPQNRLIAAAFTRQMSQKCATELSESEDNTYSASTKSISQDRQLARNRAMMDESRTDKAQQFRNHRWFGFASSESEPYPTHLRSSFSHAQCKSRSLG
jgi:hypothetical protein